MSMNIWCGVGRLTADPELKQINEQQSVCNFTLAVNRPRTKDQTDFISCSAWGQPAKFLSQYAHKGDLISVTGTLRNADYTDKEGTKHYKDGITVQDISILSPKKSSTGEGYQVTATTNPEQMRSVSELVQFSEVAIEDGLPF